MVMKKITSPKILTGDQAQNQKQGYDQQAMKNLGSNPLTGGSILPSVSLASGSNNISHKLQARLKGWIVVRQRSAATIFDDQDNNDTPDQTLKLTASAAVVVDLLVF
jgi:hypothetical protein